MVCTICSKRAWMVVAATIALSACGGTPKYIDNNYTPAPSSQAPSYVEEGVYFTGISSEAKTAADAIAQAMDDAMQQALQHTGMEVTHLSDYVASERGSAFRYKSDSKLSANASNFLSVARVDERNITELGAGGYEAWVRVFIDAYTLEDMRAWTDEVRANRLEEIKTPYVEVEGVGVAFLADNGTVPQTEMSARRAAKLDAYTKLSEIQSVLAHSTSTTEKGVLVEDRRTASSSSVIAGHKIKSESLEWSDGYAIATVVILVPNR